MSAKQSDSNSLVSICMPIRNEEAYIVDTLQSIESQTHENFEVLIFDNHSTDKTPELCREFCELDKRFKLYRNTFNLGQVYNFNRSVAPARADYIAIRSGNDIIDPRFLEKTLCLLLDNPRVGLAYSRSQKIDTDGKPEGDNYPDDSYFETESLEPVAAGVTVMRCFIHPAPYFGVYRKSLLDRLQPLRHVFASDKIFVCEASLYNDIACTSEALCFERRHKRQASLRHIFSEDAVFGVPEESIFAKFEGTTPFVDMLWGFLEMLSRASIENHQKARLCHAAISILGEHYRKQLVDEKQRLLDIFQANQTILLNRESHPVPNLNRHNFLHRVRRAQFIFPASKELKEVSTSLTELL